MAKSQENSVENKVIELIDNIEENIRQFLSAIKNSNQLDLVRIQSNTKYRALKSYHETRISRFREEIKNNVFIFKRGYYAEFVINELDGINSEIVEIHINKESLDIGELLKNTLDAAVRINKISKEINMINISIDAAKEIIEEVNNDVKFIGDGLKEAQLEVNRKDVELVDYLNKVDLLIYIENSLLNFDAVELNKIISNLGRIGIDNEIFVNIKEDYEYILRCFRDVRIYSNFLLIKFNMIFGFKSEFSKVNNLDDVGLIGEIFSNFKKLLNDQELFSEEKIEKDQVVNGEDKTYIKALRFYEIEKKRIAEEYEIKLLKSKVDNISLIDKSITHKNEFYSDKVDKLLKVENGVIRLLNYYNELIKDNFTPKEWSNILDSKNKIEYVVNSFKNKEQYKFFLLLDQDYIDGLINYFDFKLVGKEVVKFEDENSQDFIKDFNLKASNPDSFVGVGREEWNTPLFWFNVNYYALVKDYNDKYEKMEKLDNKINDYIKGNGNYQGRFDGYLENIGDEIKKAKRKVSDIVCQYNQVASLLNNVESSEKFISEIKGLYINNETRSIYEKVYSDEIKMANYFRRIALIIYLVLGFFAFTSLSFLIIGDVTSEWITKFSDPKSMLIKLPLILTLVFIGLYLSREGEKHRRFANQARQTMNELHAFTSYSTDIQDKVVEIKTKLADKYFGVTLYEAEKASSSDMDVLKTLVEQTKVTTDLIKTLQNTAGQSRSGTSAPTVEKAENSKID